MQVSERVEFTFIGLGVGIIMAVSSLSYLYGIVAVKELMWVMFILFSMPTYIGMCIDKKMECEDIVALDGREKEEQ